MTIATEIKSSNSLIYKTSKTVGEENIIVTIRLNDECKNGHQDFAITADIYEAGKPLKERYFIARGCCHDEIISAFPEFKIFVDLHLSDYMGIPMYALENGYYHLTHGFTKLEHGKTQKTEFCEYYRITPEQYDILVQTKSKTEYGNALLSLGVLSQWKEQANKAIAILEDLTGEKFVVDSVRSNFSMIVE